MIKGTRHITEFKQEAVNQAIKQGYSVNDVSERLGFSSKTLYAWTKTFSKPPKQRDNEQDLQTQIAQLQRELKRVQQERDILKEAAVFFAVESKNVTRS